MKKWIKRTLIAIPLLIVLAIIGLGLLMESTIDDPFDDRNFDSAIWKSSHKDKNHNNPRGQMIDDLFEHHLKKGLSRDEIINILGTPDLETKDDFFSYNLGMWSGFRMDYDSLDLKFDNKGKLSKFSRVQH